jgi:chromosome segregation ATPase
VPSHASPPAAPPRRAAPAIGPIATAASHRAEAAPAALAAALPAVASPSRSASRAEAEVAEVRGEVRQLAHRCDELGAIQLGLDRALEASSAALRSGQEALGAQGRDLEAQVAQQGRESVAVAQSVLALQCQLGNLQHATTEAVSELWGAQASKPQPRAPLEAALHAERDAHAATAARVARVEAELAASVSQQYRLQQQLLLMQSAQASAPTSAPPSPQCWPTTANKGV